MSVDKDAATKLWKDVFGDKEFAQDCFGTWICKFDYGDYETKRIRPSGTGKLFNYGWDIDHIRPKSDFANDSDADFFNNYEPMHRDNNMAKFDNYPGFKVNNKNFNVVICDICKKHEKLGYGILDVGTGKRIDWKARKGVYYS